MRTSNISWRIERSSARESRLRSGSSSASVGPDPPAVCSGRPARVTVMVVSWFFQIAEAAALEAAWRASMRAAGPFMQWIARPSGRCSTQTLRSVRARAARTGLVSN